MRWWRRAFGKGQRAPRDADSALRSALLAVLDRDLDEAEDLLTHAVRLDSASTEPYLALARLYRMRGEIGRAIRIHQNLLLRRGLEPDQTVAALADLAMDFRQGGFLQRAIASYDEVLSREPEHRAALRGMVPLLSSVRDYPRALEMSRRLARVEKRDGGAQEASLWVDAAEAAHAEGRSQEALRALRRGLRKDATNVRGWIALGRLEAERDRSKAALAAWKKVPELDRRSGPLVYPSLEAAFAALDRPRDFEIYLRGLLEERRDDTAARIALARALASRGEFEEALAELRRVLESDPENLSARATLGRMLLSERRDGEATKEFAELLDVLERRGLLRPRESLE